MQSQLSRKMYQSLEQVSQYKCKLKLSLFTDLFSNPVLKIPLPFADELNNILLDATNCFDSDNDIDDSIVQNNQMETYFSVNKLMHY